MGRGRLPARIGNLNLPIDRDGPHPVRATGQKAAIIGIRDKVAGPVEPHPAAIDQHLGDVAFLGPLDLIKVAAAKDIAIVVDEGLLTALIALLRVSEPILPIIKRPCSKRHFDLTGWVDRARYHDAVDQLPHRRPFVDQRAHILVLRLYDPFAITREQAIELPVAIVCAVACPDQTPAFAVEPADTLQIRLSDPISGGVVEAGIAEAKSAL